MQSQADGMYAPTIIEGFEDEISPGPIEQEDSIRPTEQRQARNDSPTSVDDIEACGSLGASTESINNCSATNENDGSWQSPTVFKKCVRYGTVSESIDSITHEFNHPMAEDRNEQENLGEAKDELRQETSSEDVITRQLNTLGSLTREEIEEASCWRSNFDAENTGKYYYFNKYTKETSWKKPRGYGVAMEMKRNGVGF